MQGKLVVYRHNDMQHIDKLLLACPPSHRKLVITDSLFSMDGRLPHSKVLHAPMSTNNVYAMPESRPQLQREYIESCLFYAGDFADLAGLTALRRKHNFLLAVDEAHATFVCGER